MRVKEIAESTRKKKMLILQVVSYMSAAFVVVMSQHMIYRSDEDTSALNTTLNKLSSQIKSDPLQNPKIETVPSSTQVSILTEMIIAEEEIAEVVVDVELSNGEKVDYILEHYNLTYEQFELVVSIVLAEAKAEGTCYEDAYAVINTVYNRMFSEKWIYTVDCCMGEGTATNLYYQVITPGQFTTYESEKYLKFLGVTNGEGYQAIIDFLYSEESMHPYLSFRASNCEADGRVQFIDGGNWYFDELVEEDSSKEYVKTNIHKFDMITYY